LQLTEMLRKLPHEVVISNVATEHEAVHAAQDWRPHVMVLDLRLKDGWGFNVLRKVVPMKERPFTVVLTNYALPQYREYAMLIGADLFLDKAIDLETLPDVLRANAEKINSRAETMTESRPN